MNSSSVFTDLFSKLTGIKNGIRNNGEITFCSLSLSVLFSLSSFFFYVSFVEKIKQLTLLLFIAIKQCQQTHKLN